MCSASMTVVSSVFARGTSGMIDASTTRRPSVPITRADWSTTLAASARDQLLVANPAYLPAASG